MCFIVRAKQHAPVGISLKKEDIKTGSIALHFRAALKGSLTIALTSYFSDGIRITGKVTNGELNLKSVPKSEWTSRYSSAIVSLVRISLVNTEEESIVELLIKPGNGLVFNDKAF